MTSNGHLEPKLGQLKVKRLIFGKMVYIVDSPHFGNGLKDPPNWFISYWIHPQPGHGPTDSKKWPEGFIYWIHYTLYSGQPTLKITKKEKK